MPENIDKIKELEKRIETLEKIVLTKDDVKERTKNYSGLRGGLKLLIDNDFFFSSPKNVQEIESELKREGYHYARPSISKALSVDFTYKQKFLSRLKEDKFWKYVIRK